MKNDFETKIRKERLDGIGDWVWPRDDEGLWLGPSQEWPAIKELILEHCTSMDTALQAGGGAGMYPRLLSEMFSTVVTFEPDPVNFFCLARNCKSRNIVKFNAALGDENRWCTFSYPVESNRGTGMVVTNTANPDYGTIGDVIMMRGDTLQYRKLDLVYLDIEGGELTAVRGLINSIKKHRPLVICENAHAGIIDYMSDFDYVVVAKSNSDTVMKSL